jgi:hypothetical protein
MSYAPVTLGLKFQIRVRDLTGRDVVVVTCPACHWSANVAPHVLYDRFHEHVRLVEVEREFLCKRCGVKGGLRWRIERARGPEFPKLA